MRYFLCGVKMVDEILGQRRTDEASVKPLLTRKKRLEFKLSLCAPQETPLSVEIQYGDCRDKASLILNLVPN
jgi:hypothetical protein